MLLWCGAMWRENLSWCSWAARARRLAPALNTDSQRRCKRTGAHRLTVGGARRTCPKLLVDLDVHPRHVDQAVTMEIYAEASSDRLVGRTQARLTGRRLTDPGRKPGFEADSSMVDQLSPWPRKFGTVRERFSYLRPESPLRSAGRTDPADLLRMPAHTGNHRGINAAMAMHSLDLRKPLRLVWLWVCHHFDHHLGLSTEIRLSAKSSFLWKVGRLGTLLDTLPMSGG